MFSLTEASIRRRAVAVGCPIAASSGSILAGESFMLRAIDGPYPKRYSGDHALGGPLVEHIKGNDTGRVH